MSNEKHEDPKSTQETLEKLNVDIEHIIVTFEKLSQSEDYAYEYSKDEELKNKMLNMTLEKLILAKSFENPDMIQTFKTLYALKKNLLGKEIDNFFNALQTLSQLSPTGQFISVDLLVRYLKK